MDKTLVQELRGLMTSPRASLVEARIREFERLKNGSEEEWFSELCFCILTANFTAKGGLMIQESLKFDGFAHLYLEELAMRLKELGHRFYNTRAYYIVEARRHLGRLKGTLAPIDDHPAREWLVGNVKGLGYKEASHFLRNVGRHSLAILDRHILRLMVCYGLIEEVKGFSKRRYLRYEETLAHLAEEMGLTLSRLDLYLWYMATGEVLK